jgi:hypothetical protein
LSNEIYLDKGVLFGVLYPNKILQVGLEKDASPEEALKFRLEYLRNMR